MPDSPQQQLAAMLSGYWLTQAVYVAAKLGLADLMQDAPCTADDLAQATNAHAPALYRLLRALASVGVFAEDSEQRFGLTPLAEYLRSDVPGSQRAMAIMSGEEHYRAYGELLHSVRTGERAFDRVFGQPVFDFLAQHADQARVFDEAMVSIHGRETAAALDAYDFSDLGVLADIGGGNGSLLIAALQRHSALRGMLFDLPGVIARATLRIESAGLADRCQWIAGNFFESIPAGADAYLMRHIIHDWTDDQCLTILGHIHRVLPPHGRLLVIESVIPAGNDPFFGKLLDLTMLTIPGGRERTLEEFRRLYNAAGFHLTRIVPTMTEVSVIEGQRI